MYTPAHIDIHVNMYACVYIYIDVYIHTYMNTYIYLCMYTQYPLQAFKLHKATRIPCYGSSQALTRYLHRMHMHTIYIIYTIHIT